MRQRNDVLILLHLQTKRDDPSNVIDYEKIDEDARVSPDITYLVGVADSLVVLNNKKNKTK